ncbi:MAG: DUF3592 domain-containing protein [Butyrivibrio sp.]
MEDSVKTIKKTGVVVAVVIGAIVVLSIIFSGIFTIMKGLSFYSKPDEGYETITAVIADIKVTKSGDDYTHDVYVNYAYNGMEYNNVPLNYYSSTMYVGEEIEIYCNKDNPSQIKGKIFGNTKILMLIVGGAFIIFPLGIFAVLIVNILKKPKGPENLMKKGIKVSGVVEQIIPEQNAQYGSSFYYVYGTYSVPGQNYTYRFVRNHVTEAEASHVYEGMPVNIYVNRKNYKDHYVEL